jgi:hypothetical protein
MILNTLTIFICSRSLQLHLSGIAMKLFLSISLTASCFTVKYVSAQHIRGRQVVARVRATGSDAGYCEQKGKPAYCDANYVLVADKFADDEVKGIYQDVFLLGGKGGIFVNVDCLNIMIDEDENGNRTAIASGFATAESKTGAGRYVHTGAKIDKDGKGYYTFVYNRGHISCEDFVENDFRWYEHVTGVVDIEIF